jgi:hypothetical protein
VSADLEQQEDLYSFIRGSFEKHAGALMNKQPHDRDLYRVAYLVELVRNIPVELIYGEDRKQFKDAVRTLLTILPRMIDDAKIEDIAARKRAHRTEFEYFVSRAKPLLEAAEPFRSMAKKTVNKNGSWHFYAQKIAEEVRTILEHGGMKKVSFTNGTSPGVLIVAELTGKTVSNVIEHFKDHRKQQGK